MKTTWISWFLIFAMGFCMVACSSPEERARAHYQSGKQLLEAGEFLKAGLEFRNALKYNEKSPEAWFGLAVVEEKNLNWPAVADDLKRVVELDAKNFEALTKLAKLQLAAVQLDQALKNVNTANDLKKDDTSVLALRAAILFRLNDREGARADAERALASNPDNPDALAVLAADQIADGNATAALRFVDRGLVKDANNIGLLMFKLKVFEDTGDDLRLEATLRQIMAANPQLKELRQALLGFLASRNRIADVEIEMRAALAADPDNTTQALDLVRLVTNVKGAGAARKELETLIAAKPGITEYKLALAKLDFSDARIDAAIAAVEAVIAKGEPKDAVQRAQLLLAAMKSQLGRVDEAKALIDTILAGDANNADGLALRANLGIEAGDIDGAVADLRAALNQRPKSVPFMALLGRAHERQGAVDLANDSLMEALKASNYDPQIVLDYIAFLRRQGTVEQIETILNEALPRNPNDMRLLTLLAQVRLNKQDWIGAEAVANALKKGGDTSGVGLQIMGAVQLGQKKYDESIATLQEAYAATPETARPLYSLVLAYLQSGKISEAETFIQSILSANPNNADALVLMGSIKELQKNNEDAATNFKLAIERQPSNPVGYAALSKYHLSHKQTAEAEAILRQGREMSPRDLSINLGLAGLLEMKNDVEGAILIYEEQLKSTPDALIVINNLASLLADYRSDTASLEKSYQLSRRLESVDVPQFQDTVGWVAYRRGDFRAALSSLEAAAQKLPDLALVKYHLAMNYVALKRNADAKDQLAKAEALLKEGDPLNEKIRAAVAALPASN